VTARAARAAGLAAAALVLLAAGPARAQHDHHHADHAAPADGDGDRAAAEAPRRFELGLTLVGARFDQPLYEGDYAGAAGAVGWRHGRLGVRAALPAYHLRKNGASIDGVGDVSLGVDATVYRRGPISAGVTVGASLPTGDAMSGLGMGHPMLMPAAWVARDGARTSLGVSAGWCGAIGGAGDHAHGAWPLVEPMSSSELMGDARVDRALAGRLRGGARVMVAFPLQGETTRVVAAVGGTWRGARADTGAELQAGLSGDPFTIRAVVTSALRF
jgi:hypothetical protein